MTNIENLFKHKCPFSLKKLLNADYEEQKGTCIFYKTSQINRIDMKNEDLVIPLMYRIVSEYKSNEPNTRSEFDFKVITFNEHTLNINLLVIYEISCYPRTKPVHLGELEFWNGRTTEPCAINLAVRVQYIKPNENLFKHNINFHKKGKEITRFPNINNNAHLNAVFQSDIINDAKEKGITMYQDITNGIGPYLYYLASKYKNFSQWDLNCYEPGVTRK